MVEPNKVVVEEPLGSAVLCFLRGVILNGAKDPSRERFLTALGMRKYTTGSERTLTIEYNRVVDKYLQTM